MNILYECVKAGNPHPVVSALVIHENRVLMVLRGKGSFEGHWALPGGMIDRREEPEAAVLREFREEAGVICSYPKLLHAYRIECTDAFAHTSIDLVYSVQMAEESLLQADGGETQQVAFFPLNELPELIAFGHRDVIAKFSKP